MKIIGLILLLVLVTACHPKTSLYAPRREATPAHRQATKVADCLGCHEVEKYRLHQPDENCFRCHKICEGC